MKKRNINF